MSEKSNSLGRNIPSQINGLKYFESYKGEKYACNHLTVSNVKNKVAANMKAAIAQSGLKDGMTISFHHHLRNGDFVLNHVMDVIAECGIKNLTICASSITEIHEGLIDHIQNGVVKSLHTSGLRGKLGKEISIKNILENPVIFRTHGGRARAIMSGSVKIDVAFIAASCCDEMGNMNGQKGKSAFGSMGYPMIDALYANKVVAVTDNLVEYPAYPISIAETLVDIVAVVDAIGDPQLIGKGATRLTRDPRELLIAEYANRALVEAGVIKNGFSFQAGSGGSSLAVAKFLGEYMGNKGLKGSFASGGITSCLVDLLERGIFKTLLDVQTFDAAAVDSLIRNSNHIEMSASMYANPLSRSCVSDHLDVMILSATEVDIDFNVNVMTSSTGMIMGAQGGHPDTAAGAKLTIVVTPLLRKRIPIIVERVTTVVTPGSCVDMVVTDRGIAINPKNTALLERFKRSSLPLCSIEDLKNEALSITGLPEKIIFTDRIVGVVEYRDGTIIDVIRGIQE